MNRYSPNAGPMPLEEIGRVGTPSNNMQSQSYYSPRPGGITYPSPEFIQPPRPHYSDIYRTYAQDVRPFRYPPPTSISNGSSMYQTHTSNQYPQPQLTQYPSPSANQYTSPIPNQYPPPSAQYQSPPPNQYPSIASNQFPQTASNQYPRMGSQSQFPSTYGQFERDPTFNAAAWSQYQQQRQQLAPTQLVQMYHMVPSPVMPPNIEPVPPPNLPELSNYPHIAAPKASPPPPIVETDCEATPVDEEDVKKPVKKPVILVGKRRGGGKVLPTGNLGVSKKPRLENEKGRSDAWSLYMAEVKLYKDRSCEEDRKNRPLVK